MKTVDFIREHHACREGAKWALSISEDMADVWNSLVEQKKHEWLRWTATRPGVFPAPTLRRLACSFVRETPLHDGRTVWDLLTDERSRNAIEVAELYADGKVTADELSAARDAADAAHAAARDAADTASYADVCAASTYAYDAAYYAAYYAAYADSCAAASYAAAHIAAHTADDAAHAAGCAADSAAKSAQIKMIAELGNPFRKESVK